MANIPIPKELKGFYEVFTRLSYGKTDSEIFDDFLLWIMAGFSYDIKWNPSGKYTPKQTPMFGEMFRELIQGISEILKHREWCDPFGMFYESAISSYSRRAGAGQFFTPENVVDLMVQIQGESTKAQKNVDNLTRAGIRVGDPACGSGRMLISFHVHYPGNLLFGEDIDRTCCLMTVCNMLLSGAVGEVVWHNSLAPDSWFGGWRINETLGRTGIPIIREIEKEQSFSYQSWQAKKAEIEAKKLITTVEPVSVFQPILQTSSDNPLPSGTQLTLFF